MAVLISGGTGFVGLNLAEALLSRGEHVVLAALDAPPAAAAAHFATLPGRLETAVIDVTDPAAFKALLQRHAVDRLFPFAAITSGPARESEAAEQVVSVNLLGFLSQLRGARDAGVRRVIIPSSAAVYGESFYAHAAVDEAATPCVPTSLYGVTKYAVERSGLRLGALWGMDVIAARIGALFGPWERDTGLRDTLSPYWQVARIARAGGEAVLPATLPPYASVYARDAASGLLHLLDMADPPHRVFNVCSGLNWGSELTGWCERLTSWPGFRWRQAQAGELPNVQLSDARPRGRMDIARIAATGWAPRFPPAPAFDDYHQWMLSPAALA